MEILFLFVSSISNLNRSSASQPPSAENIRLVVLIIILPIVLLLSVGLYKKYRARVRRQRIKALEKLYYQTSKKRKI